MNCNVRSTDSKIKKVVRWGKGLAVYVTIEARKLGWTDKDYVRITISKDNKDKEYLVLTKVE
jgi:hypothetical protein